MIDNTIQSAVIPAESPAPSSKRSSRRLRQWFRRVAISGCLFVTTVAIACKVYLVRVESNAQRLASTGTSLNTFLKSYVDAPEGW